MSGPATFSFLGITREARAVDDWNHPEWAKLWLYNLHYFDDLNADGASERTDWHRALVARWIAENPPAAGNGWEPYPASLRIVNWVKWALAGNVLADEARHSLAVQVRWLCRRLEWHLLGNHLLANAKALVFAGSFFGGAEAEGWRKQGFAILARELPEQILEDGGHFERSPMYQAIILEDLLDLLQLSQHWPGLVEASVVAGWRAKANAMLGWSAAMCHPDGEIAFFNDAAIGIAPDLAALVDYARLSGIGPPSAPAALRHFASSGYVRAQVGTAVLMADVGEIGPDYLPGHAHADTLSFELSVQGQRVVVNSGISEYGVGAERLRQRGTAAHSTVQIDGEDSSEVWGGFRVARRARPFDLTAREEGETVVIEGSHDGYARLKGRPIHHRQWRLGSRRLCVTDTISGQRREAIARYHLHPSVAAFGGTGVGILRLPSGKNVHWSVSGGTASIVASTFHPAFGVTLPSQCIELRFEGARASILFEWG